MAVVVVGGGGKDAIVAAAINCCHSQRCHHQHPWLNPTTAAIDNDRYCRHQQRPLSPPSTITIATATQSTTTTARSQLSLFVLDGGNGGLLPHSRR